LLLAYRDIGEREIFCPKGILFHRLGVENFKACGTAKKIAKQITAVIKSRSASMAGFYYSSGF